jgi:hypothetical protein
VLRVWEEGRGWREFIACARHRRRARIFALDGGALTANTFSVVF